jgi:diaminohydroxyphosphoribosylaminopyrimidine deaminase/5-amino-6-(5-phosphoribosylamino)uracil reductase
MKKAIELASGGKGYTSPNPLVGTVIVKDNRIIGEGFHQKYGDKHAEIIAIDAATESVEGATLYCNLEPCTNNIPQKKTPPCTERIIKEKLSRVVIATADPNPYVNGGGIDRLRKSGIRVDMGTMKDSAIQLNEKYFIFHKHNRPFIHLKIAQSLDGRIATSQGNSKWITNENALRLVHQLRSEHDAVLVGINTILQDDSFLTVRNVPGRNPVRIILDNDLVIPLDAKALTVNEELSTIIFTAKSEIDEKAVLLLDQGIKVITVATTSNKHLDLIEILEHLYQMGISSVMVEGGSEIFTSFIKQQLFDKITFFISPMLIGTGIQSIGNLGIESLDKAYRLENVQITIIDHQAVMEGYRDYASLMS